MRSYVRLIVCFALLCFAVAIGAQNVKIKQQHKVKKSETLFGISRKYNVSLEDLVAVNPEMSLPDYQLKKGDYINIPFPSDNVDAASAANQQKKDEVLPINRQIRVGVMLPLHDVNGDGRRMIEYYRGLLLACNRLKQDNISIDIRAWNVPVDADIRTTLLDNEAQKCDIIFGPLYSNMVKPLGDFCKRNDIMMVIPFSITGNDVATNDHIFQVYQEPAVLNTLTAGNFVKLFNTYHPIIVDAGDATSDKGAFTTELRSKLEKTGVSYSITHLQSSDADFQKAFSPTQRNIVVINTGKSPELNTLFQRFDKLKAANPNIQVSLFGYTDWFIYTQAYQNYFHKYDTYIPSTFYYNSTTNDTKWVEANYKKWFKADMMYAIPHFGLTGFDHGCFFIGGFHKYGHGFTGGKGQATYRQVQTPLQFSKIGNNGGMQNSIFMFVHYKEDKLIDAINF